MNTTMNKYPILMCKRCHKPCWHTFVEERRLRDSDGDPQGFEQVFSCYTCKTIRRWGCTVQRVIELKKPFIKNLELAQGATND